MTGSLKQLYNKLILERQKDQSGYEKREHADHIIEAYNPVCGDQFKLYLDLDGAKVSNASYHGYGCALSKASTSLLIAELPGKTIEECSDFIETYFDHLETETSDAEEIIKALAMAKNFPGRKQCTVLSWEAVKRWLKSRPTS